MDSDPTDTLTLPFLQEHLLDAVYDAARDGIRGIPALERAFVETNNDLRKHQNAYTCGSTATTVVLDGRRIISANAGDSPAFVVWKSGELVEIYF